MRFPDVKRLGTVSVEGAGTFTVYMVNDAWEPDDGHDKEHARGGCECPCYPPLDALDAAATVAEAVRRAR